MKRLSFKMGYSSEFTTGRPESQKADRTESHIHKGSYIELLTLSPNDLICTVIVTHSQN